MDQEQAPAETEEDEFYATARAAGVARANTLKAQAAAGGLHFRAYLPPMLASWLIDQIARGAFIDPSEAVFVMLGEQRELEPHADLRKEILRRSLQAAIDDPRPRIDSEEARARMEARLAQKRPEPAHWDADVSAHGSASTV